tara:strand:- start:310 stop:1725 length:1416 start_codon:yes stop_codon:yes gene_type:complete
LFFSVVIDSSLKGGCDMFDDITYLLILRTRLMTTPNNQPNEIDELPEDLFGREAIAEKIKGLLESNIDLSPMAIDGDWGIGKTVFCHRLIKKIKESGKLNCVYIDAFRADHVDDPLITIISEIGKMVVKKEGQRKLNSFISNAKPFLRTATKTLGKAAVSIALKQSTDEITEGYDKEVEALTGASIDASIDLIIRDKINAEKNLGTLQDALEEVTKNKELVILIDELDRCRANFAIDMLETIKHIFTSKRVKIVIVANSSQLEAAFRHRYGSNDHTKNYFEKFYKYKHSLPLEKTPHYRKISVTTTHSYNHLINLIKNSNLNIEYGNNTFKCGIEDLIRNQSLSLREVDQIFKIIQVIFILKDQNALFITNYDSLISILFIYLNIKKPFISIYNKSAVNSLLGRKNFKIENYNITNQSVIDALLFIINSRIEVYTEDNENGKHAENIIGFTRPYIYILETFGEIREILNIS